MVELSQRVDIAIKRIFCESDWNVVSDLLRREHADNLPMMHGIYDTARYDRGRLALLKLSSGNLDKLHKAVALGKRDWRDLLMAAGFGQLDAHLDWYQSILTQSLIVQPRSPTRFSKSW